MKFLLYTFLLFATRLPAQNILKGKIVDETNHPIEGASIYYNNTSVGTSSNNAGEFTIIQPGIANAELVISSVGFQSLVHKIEGIEFTERSYLFQLKARESTMENVLVLSDLSRKRYLELFTENFLGITEEASMSRIINTDAVVFTNAVNEPRMLGAFTDTPLVIVNKMLGYKLHFQLEMFKYDKENGNTSFYGFTRYEEMGEKKRFIKNRHKAYYGSTMHFYRSLVANKLEEEMYKVFTIKELKIKTDTGVQTMETAYPVSSYSLIKTDSAEHVYKASWDNKLMVQYQKNPSSKLFLTHATFLQGNLPVGFRSWLTLQTPFIRIDASGVVQDPLSITYSGYWIYEKAANLLPLNYQP